MTWSTIRKVTEEDYELLEKRAEAFADRHDIELDYFYECGSSYRVPLESELGYGCEPDNPNREHYVYLRQLWRRVMRRALREPGADGIAYGYIGCYAD